MTESRCVVGLLNTFVSRDTPEIDGGSIVSVVIFKFTSSAVVNVYARAVPDATGRVILSNSPAV